LGSNALSGYYRLCDLWRDALCLVLNTNQHGTAKLIGACAACSMGLYFIYGLLLIGFLFDNTVHFALVVVGGVIAAVFGVVGFLHVNNGNRLRR